ncbi:MAG: hypothetical protein EP330_22545 [Deltaproteobacteria bacterium]|nr:MAG: hypothetical protein EP330_22545 [Deltaproteobacteria bacterium]
MTEVSVQLGLYGGTTELTDFHVVAAHTRVLADGSTTFVAEHLRWNRGRQAPRARVPRTPTPDERHPSLFGAPSPVEHEASPPDEPPEAGDSDAPEQLTLW